MPDTAPAGVAPAPPALSALFRLGTRDRRPEMMDQPGLDPADHAAALKGLERLNRVSRTAATLWPHLERLAKALPAGRPLRVLDAATGGGDVPVLLARWARRAGLAVEFAGCDISPSALAYADRRAAAAGVPVTFFRHDILAGPPAGPFDVATCNLFLHHLSDADAVTLLKHLAAAGRAVLVNDLARGPLSYAIVWAGTRLLSRSPIVRTDGPLSVRAAFTPAEAAAVADRAGLSGASITRQHPCRFLLAWERA